MNTLRKILNASVLVTALAMPAAAQFTGPSQGGQTMNVAALQSVAFGTYVTLEGTIVAHLREDYYLFSDGSGEVQLEIEPGTFRNQSVGPQTRVRLVGEVDRRAAGQRYVWVSRMELL